MHSKGKVKGRHAIGVRGLSAHFYPFGALVSFKTMMCYRKGGMWCLEGHERYLEGQRFTCRGILFLVLEYICYSEQFVTPRGSVLQKETWALLKEKYVTERRGVQERFKLELYAEIQAASAIMAFFLALESAVDESTTLGHMAKVTSVSP